MIKKIYPGRAKKPGFFPLIAACSGDRNSIVMKTSIHSNPAPASPYLVCPFKKGRPKKHIDVCRKCRKNRKCAIYQDYMQPGLFPGWR
jgi:hypothetical protein